ncbi:MAG: DegT/DnrJ/EryC1/StrS family aminotransferase [Planctomycetota bacterium]
MTDWKVPYSMRGCLIEEDDFQIVREAMQQESLSGGGKYTQEFQKRFAEYTGAKHALTCANGTVALEMAAQAIGIGEGDEALVPAITFFATALAPLARGARVRFVDIDPRTLNMDPDKIAGSLTAKTKAIFPVHLGGLSCDMDAILGIARERGLAVVDDAAHAPGAECRGRRIGAIGDITTFSFHTWKNMCTLGEGGMVTTSDDELARQLAKIKGFGAEGIPGRKVYGMYGEELPFYMDFKRIGGGFGSNRRLSDVQAAMGVTQIGKLDRANELRRRNAAHLTKRLAEVEEVTCPYEPEGYKHVYHLYTLLYEADKVGAPKDDFLRSLVEDYGIQCWIQYVPVYLFTVFREMGHAPGECPVAEEIFRKKLVSLPIGPTMTLEQMDYVAKAVKETVGKLLARKRT